MAAEGSLKILALVGSHRKNGNTARAVNGVLDALKAEAQRRGIAADMETVNVAQADLAMCRGCRVCFDQGEEKCPLGGDALKIYEKMARADGVICASPVYVEDVSGAMKTFIDRMAFVSHRPAFFGKFACFVTTSGIGATLHACKTMSVALRTWGYHIGGRDTLKTGALMTADEMQRTYGRRFNNMAHKILKAAGKCQSPSFFSLMTFRIQQVFYRQIADKSSIDYAYWHRNGWLDSKRRYYSEAGVRRVKAIAARSVGAAIGKIVLK